MMICFWRRPDPLKPFTAQRPSERTIARIPIDSICISPFQPRRAFHESSIAELAESIRQHGLLTPLLVRRIAAGQYELIAGERRLRALTMLNCAFAESIIVSAFDCDSALMALVENLQREDLHYLDEAEACRSILDAHHITQEQLARSLSISPSALANRLRLLKLTDEVRSALRQFNLSERHARALLRLTDVPLQLELVRECAAHRLSVKQLETRIDRLLRTPVHRSHVSPIIRDNRIIINAVLDTVKDLNRIGVHVESRIEERDDGVEVIVRIPRTST